MNFCYLHQIKDETCMHEKGMNIKRHLREEKNEKKKNTYIHTHTHTCTDTHLKHAYILWESRPLYQPCPFHCFYSLSLFYLFCTKLF